MSPEPPRWRTVFTDSESESGVAETCQSPGLHRDWEMRTYAAEYQDTSVAGSSTYDCCPGLALQCINVADARELAAWMNEHGVEICG